MRSGPYRIPSGPVRSGPFRSGPVQSGPVGPKSAASNSSISLQTASDLVGPVWPSPIQSDPVRSGPSRRPVCTKSVRSVPEQVAQEISLEDGESEITHIGARPFNGVIQGSLKNTHSHRILKDSDSTIDFIHNHVIHQR